MRLDLSTERSVSRESNGRKDTKAVLLNKEEVIGGLPRISKLQSTEHLRKTQKSSWIDAFIANQNETLIGMPDKKQLFKEFSVVRLMNRISEH
jgi:transposase